MVSWTKRPWPFLTTTTQKSLNQIFACLNLYQHTKNNFIPYVPFWCSVLASCDQTGHKHLWPCPPKDFWSAFNFCGSVSIIIYYYSIIYQFISSLHSSDTVSLRVAWPDWPYTFLIMPTQKIFNHLLICMDFHQPTKNQLTPLVHPLDTVSFRVSRPEWPFPLLTIPNQKFSINF